MAWGPALQSYTALFHRKPAFRALVMLMPGNNPGGIWITMLLGIAGSLLATWFLQLMGHYEEGQTAGWIASFGGAFVLLAIYHFFRRYSGLKPTAKS